MRDGNQRVFSGWKVDRQELAPFQKRREEGRGDDVEVGKGERKRTEKEGKRVVVVIVDDGTPKLVILGSVFG
jgi:predicted phosphoribosyltransferase